MSTITFEMVREAYSVAKRVYEKEIIRQKGINDLVNRVNFTESSAADTIDKLRHMLEGERYERKNNLDTTSHFLAMIHQDYGLPALRNALAALEQHLDYYEQLDTGGPQPGQRKLLAKYRAVADHPDGPRGPDGLTASQRATITHEEEQLRVEGVFDPSDEEDARKRTLANIVRRQGQGKFRTQLLALYGHRCAVSGCSAEAVLEAAHIKPYLGPKTNHPTNGLILRADLHTLFDLRLISVDPKTLTVLVSPTLDGTEYVSYRGKALLLPKEESGRPSPAVLNQHRKQSGL